MESRNRQLRVGRDMRKNDSMKISQYINSTEAQQKLYKRSLIVVIMSQIFGGAGLAAGITVGALLAKDMLGTASFAGLPTALFTLGSALSAFLVGRISQRFGRRYGLSFGFIAGGVGAIAVVIAATMDNVYLLFLALFVYGAGTSTNLQARYAGTDLANDKQRATAISIAMVSTTFGAVAEKIAADGNQTVQSKVNRAGVLVGAMVLVISHIVMVGIMSMMHVGGGC